MLSGVQEAAVIRFFFFQEVTMLSIGFPFRSFPKFLDRETAGVEMSKFTLSFSLPTFIFALGKKKIKDTLLLTSPMALLEG